MPNERGKKETNSPKKETKKSLGKLINIMVWEYLSENRDGLSEAQLIDKIIEDYGLDEAASLEQRGIDTASKKSGNTKQDNPVRQSVRGQVRRALEALCSIEDYLDMEKDGAASFKERYGVEIVDEDEDGKEKQRKLYKLHSTEGQDAHRLTDEELRILLFHIRVSQSITGKQATNMITKLMQYGSREFRDEIKLSFVGKDFLSGEDMKWDREFIEPDYVMKNMALLQNVINKNMEDEKNKKEPELNIAFEFYAYDESLRLQPSEEILGTIKQRRVATPLKVFSDMGRVYAFVATENKNKEKKKEKPWIFLSYRVDLMRDMKKINTKESGSKVYIPTKEQREELRIGNIKKYLNMSFSSEVEEIQFLFLRERITALVDSFGKNIKITRFTEEERDAGKAVVKLKKGEKEISVFDENRIERVLCKVYCTRFGFVNWAMQYSDYAQVLEPKEVVEEIKDKIRNLVTRYEISMEKGEGTHG